MIRENAIGPVHTVVFGGQHPLLLGRVQTRVKKPCAQVGARAPCAQGAIVLLGQHGRGRHEQSLTARPRGVHAGRESHRGFAAANVPLQQALHGRWRGHGLEDGVHRPLLRAGEGERQRGPHFG